MTNDQSDVGLAVNSIYGHLIGFVLGIAGAAIAAAIGSQGMGGFAGDMTAQMAGVLGFVIGYAVGFLIGTLPIFPAEKPAQPVYRRQGPPQVAGQPCAVCAERIVFITDGVACPKCETIYHTQCAEGCPKCDASPNT
jgi:hypothetical protein